MHEALTRRLQDYAESLGEPGGYRLLTPHLGLSFNTVPYAGTATVYQPLVCLILQGAKRTRVGPRQMDIRPGQFLLVSHHLPVVAHVTEATVDQPYLGLVARLDLAELRSLDAELPGTEPSLAPPRSFEVDDADPALISVFARLVEASGDPDDTRVLVPMLRRELHYRLLRSRRGGMLRQLLNHQGQANHIRRAIRILREGYRARMEMEDVAREVGMSPSSFYKHFKSITETTPLQYQKNLRLTEAQRLLRGGQHTVSTAAYEVGYESPSQFSREYARKFGVPPKQELRLGA